MPDVMEMSKTRDQIERRAYEIYLARGCQDGYDIADWLSAEKELNEMAQELSSRSAVAPQSSVQTDVAILEPEKVTKKMPVEIGSKTKFAAASQAAV